MSFQRIIVITSFFAISSASCTKLRGNGEMINIRRDMSPFKSIVTDVPADIDIKRSGDYELNMEVESNIEAHIITEVKDSVLTIRYKNKNDIIDHNDIYIHILTPSLSGLTINGSSDVRIDTLSSDVFTSHINGSGSLNVGYISSRTLEHSCNGSGQLGLNSGILHFKDVTINGSGEVKADQVLSTISRMTINGSGDIYTHTTDSMYIRISGSGNVYYEGDPKINISVVGSGAVQEL